MKLKLENFRNHKNFELELDPITIIVGGNGTGKSNILEALSLLSLCRSFRDVRKRDLVNLEADFARLTLGESEMILVKSPIFSMKVRLSGAAKKLVEFIGLTPSVALSPESLEMVAGGPALRRRFLDMMISQADRVYLTALIDFEQVKKQRNILLRRIKHNQARLEELNYWDKEFVAQAAILTQKRTEVAAKLNQGLTEAYSSIAGRPANLELAYFKNYEDLELDLSKNRYRDVADERSSVGPHRDDWILSLDKLDMAKFASRGEIKSAVLALKVAEINFVQNKRQNSGSSPNQPSPLLLLDDIFSEFDPARRGQLTGLVSQYQTVITTADRGQIPEGLLKKAKVVEL